MAKEPGTIDIENLFGRYDSTKDLWNVPDIGDAFRTPMKSDIRVFFAHGDWDDNTPIENTYEIAKSFENHFLQVIERGTHGALWWEQIAPFFETGSFDGLRDRVKMPTEIEPPPDGLNPRKKRE